MFKLEIWDLFVFPKALTPYWVISKTRNAEGQTFFYSPPPWNIYSLLPHSCPPTRESQHQASSPTQATNSEVPYFQTKLQVPRCGSDYGDSYNHRVISVHSQGSSAFLRKSLLVKMEFSIRGGAGWSKGIFRHLVISSLFLFFFKFSPTGFVTSSKHKNSFVSKENTILSLIYFY